MNMRDMYELYNDAGRAEPVNEAFEAVQTVLKEHGLRVANDDTAEALVTEITRYVFASGNLALDGAL